MSHNKRNKIPFVARNLSDYGLIKKEYVLNRFWTLKNMVGPVYLWDQPNTHSSRPHTFFQINLGDVVFAVETFDSLPDGHLSDRDITWVRVIFRDRVGFFRTPKNRFGFGWDLVFKEFRNEV